MSAPSSLCYCRSMPYLRSSQWIAGTFASLCLLVVACDSDPKDTAASDGTGETSGTTSSDTGETTGETSDATTSDATTDATTGDSEGTTGETTASTETSESTDTGETSETTDSSASETGETTETSETGETTETSESSDSSESETGEPNPSEVMICGPDAPDDPLFIFAAEITGDTMYVHLSYSGGCEEHELSHCWDGAFAESEPVQAFTRIAHNANMDACEAEIEEMLEIDLTPMKTAWQEGYQQDSGTILVHLEGWQDVLTYTF